MILGWTVYSELYRKPRQEVTAVLFALRGADDVTIESFSIKFNMEKRKPQTAVLHFHVAGISNFSKVFIV